MVSKNVVIALSLAAISLLSCREKQAFFLKDQSKYLALATDLYLMQVAMEQAPQPLRDSLFTIYQTDIKIRHNVDEQAIKLFYEALSSHPQEAMIFYDSLSAYVTQMETLELQKSIDEKDHMPEN